jgi:ketosteroid isomerase-like protein
LSQEAIAKLARGHEAFNHGDVSTMMEISTPDVEWVAAGAFPGVEGVYRGPAAVEQWVDAIRSAWGEFEVSLDEVLHDAGDVLVVTERLWGRGRGSGVEVEMCVFSTYWFEEGKIRRREAFTDREAALEAAGLRE